MNLEDMIYDGMSNEEILEKINELRAEIDADYKVDLEQARAELAEAMAIYIETVTRKDLNTQDYNAIIKEMEDTLKLIEKGHSLIKEEKKSDNDIIKDYLKMMKLKF